MTPSRPTGHTSGILASPAQPSKKVALEKAGGFPASGSDPALGAWQGWTLSYTGGKNGTIPFTCTFKHFTSASVDAIVFEHSFPKGVANLNTTNAAGLNHSSTFAASAGGGEFSAATTPSTFFPSWVAGDAEEAATDTGYLTWTGRFYGQQSAQSGGVSEGLANGFGGAMGGPVVFFTPPASSTAAASASASANAGSNTRGAGSGRGGGASLVLSPLSNPHGTIMGDGGSVGINSYATHAPAGFAVSSIAVFSNNGITDAMHAFGAVVLRAAAPTSSSSNSSRNLKKAALAVPTPKVADPSSSQLTYWTDNGAYYDFYAYEPDITSKGVPQDVLVELSQTFKNGTYPGKPLPVKGIMLDVQYNRTLPFFAFTVYICDTGFASFCFDVWFAYVFA